MKTPGWQILVGDVRDWLRQMPDESIHCAVTSPPYWALRNYQVEGQLGLEPTFDQWLENMVAIFRDLRRVLRRDGTFWLNVGQSYSGQRSFKGSEVGTDGVFARRAQRLVGGESRLEVDTAKRRDRAGCGGSGATEGFKTKDLIMQGPLLAEALRRDGWYLRACIIWAKRNCLPESVKDRPGIAHEYVFLLTREEKYFYDMEAVRQPFITQKTGDGDWTTGSRPEGKAEERGQRHRTKLIRPSNYIGNVNGRNLRTVWEAETGEESVWWVNPQPFPGRHFAIFPEKLVEPCIKAGTSERGCCPLCGAPWRREVEKGAPDRDHQQLCGADAEGGYDGQATKDYAGALAQDASATKARILAGMRERISRWEQDCECPPRDPVPCVVLDPFGGSGTVSVVAERLGRASVLIELSPEYAAMAAARISDPDWIKKERARLRVEKAREEEQAEGEHEEMEEEEATA